VKTLRFEPLSIDHIPTILEIEKDANPAPWSERSFLNELSNPQSLFKVALEGGRVVGYGGVWMLIDEAHITNVAIAAEMRRRGIGRRLMIELLKEAKDRGMLCSTLEVRASNEGAIKMYEKLGYTVTTVRKGYYPNNREDAIVMWLHDLDKWQPPKP
jgi:[ribosomal protein S18]-alanine N-acetyltransferase